MKNILLSLFVMASLLASVGVAHAGGSSGKSKMSQLYQRHDGLIGAYKEVGSWNNPDGCQKSNFAVVTGSNPYRKDFYSSLLSTKMADKETQFYLSGCVPWNGTTYPVILGVHTY